VRLNADGSVNVLTSSVEMGQGLKTVLAIFAAETLGVGTEVVEVSGVDTDVTPYDQQTSASRSTYAMGGAVRDAATDVVRQVLDEAATLLEVDARDLEAVAGEVRPRGAPAPAVSFADVLRRRALGNVIGHGRFQAGGGLDPETGQGVASVHWHQAAAGAEVEVDLETGCVDVTRLAVATYAGRVMSRTLAELQSEGCVAFGLGQALFEELRFDEGQLQNGNLGEYMIPSMKDLPRELVVDLVEDPEEHGIHGLGETSLPPIMPAIANAVCAATGVRITSLPLTPEKVLRALRDDGARS
jgi:CO/xanthine dehydrogenase Mo-binding subunit